MPTGAFPTVMVFMTSFVAGSMRETVPSAAFVTHAGRHRSGSPRPVADGDRSSPLVAGARLEPGDVIVLGAGHPDGVLAGGHPGRASADGEFAHAACFEREWVEALHARVCRVRDPDRAEGDQDVGRALSRDGQARLPDWRRVHACKRRVAECRPDRPVADGHARIRERDGPLSEPQSARHAVERRIDAIQRPEAAVDDPYRSHTGRDAVGRRRKRTFRTRVLVSGSIRLSDWSSRLATQTAPSPCATSPGRTPTEMTSSTRFELGSITATEFGGTVTGTGSSRTSSIATYASAASRTATTSAATRRSRERRVSGSAEAGSLTSGARSRRILDDGRSGKRRVVAKDRALQVSQLLTRLQAELVVQPGPNLPVDLERVGRRPDR